MNPIIQLLEQAKEIESRLSYVFKNRQLLLMSFIHRSFFNENRTIVDVHNERLEFLGDSVLGLIVSDYLYENLPTHAEGELSHLRSQIVDATACVNYLNKLGLAEFVLLGRGEKMNDGKGRETILADLFEAIIGAIYLDGGLQAAKLVFFKHFLEDLKVSLKDPVRNWKAELQDYSQKRYQKPPIYRVIDESGPDHHKTFVIAALIDDKEVGMGSGSSKKQAEAAAAADALSKMTISHG